jgi:phenylacetate-CoA ligase
MNPQVVRKLVYPLYRRLRRDDVLAHLDHMHRVEQLDPEEVRQYQWTKLMRILEHASRNVPLYRERFRKIGLAVGDLRGPEDLRSIPLLSKRDIRERQRDLLAEAYPRRDLEPDRTSGSTGESLYFFVDKMASQARRANNIRMNQWIDIQVGDKMACLWATHPEPAVTQRLLQNLRSWFSNTLTLSHFTMDDRTLGHYLKNLARFHPDLLVGYPSGLKRLCDFIRQQGGDGIRPRAVLASGETLYDWQRHAIEETLATRVYDHYGCREFGAIARECNLRDGLHLACDRVFVEAIPGAADPSGQIAELVITDLDNVGMPLVRYAIEDTGSVTWERCGCGMGLPRLKNMMGRTFDLVRAPNGNYVGGTFWTIMLKDAGGIERFQVIQEELDQVTIVLVPNQEFTDRTRQYVIEKVHQLCGRDMKIRFDIRPSLETTPSGKHRFVVSRLGLDTGRDGQAIRS